MPELSITQTVIGDRNIFTGKGDINVVYNVYNLPPIEADTRRNLLILLKKVKQFWIEGVLEQSIYYEALIQLGREFWPKAIERHPWERVLELPERSRGPIPADKEISEIFDDLGRTLLIIGEPGSGKTITLLELARGLTIHAENDDREPIPVVFNLSTWEDKRASILDWLVSELTTKYQVPQRFGRPWLENMRLLLLLDGLDEVKPDHRVACVNAINEFVEKFGAPGIAVCSRMEEYLALPVYLKLSGAICLQPLTNDNINDYLVKAGPQLVGLNTVLQGDPILQEIAKTPLMLNVMSLAYRNLPVESLMFDKVDTLEARRKKLFDTYIERMFKRKGETDQPYTRERVIKWLSWLAKKMSQHSRTVFLIEELQPSWLSTQRELWSYVFISWLIPGLIFGAINGLLAGFHALHGIDMAFLLFVTLIVSISGLVFGLFGLIFMLLRSILLGKMPGDIKTVEALGWSWANVLRSRTQKLIFAIMIFSWIIMLFPLLFNLSRSGDVPGKSAAVPLEALMGVTFWLIIFPLFFILIGGLQRRSIETKSIPNQGIILSVKNASWVGLFIGLIGGIIGLIFWRLGDIEQMDMAPLNVLLNIGLLIGILRYGGIPAIQHYALRLIISFKGLAPLNYAPFLDYAAKLIFLRKVGGGYIFIHRMLLEHFASLRKESCVT